MKKLFILVVIGCILVGCVSTQDKIDAYKEKRDAVANKIIKTYEKKECIKQCNESFGIGLNRANCKAQCVKK